jgi:hypothetical protein
MREKHRVKTQRFWLLGGILSVLHLGFTLFGIMVSFGASMRRFDDPNYPVSPVSDTLGDIVGILMLPGRLVWTSWMSKNMPNSIEWALFLANSALWGFGIAFVIERLSIRWRQARVPQF